MEIAQVSIKGKYRNELWDIDIMKFCSHPLKKKKQKKTTGTQNNFVQTYMFQDKTTTSYFT